MACISSVSTISAGARAMGRRPVSNPAARRSSVTVRSAFTLAPPPFELDALEPHISKRTMEFHWGKHHQTYVNNLNAATEGKPEADMSLEDIMMKSWNNGAGGGLFNNAGQVWNHDFYWNSMKPNGGGEPSGKLMDMINASFGSFDDFKSKFIAAGAPGPAFGSGWVWLVEKDGKLEIQFTTNAENPVVLGTGNPLITYDVWEHAYYLDYQNARPSYVTTFVEKLVDWDAAAARLSA
uniref:Superoxide dismutase n=1 Tax=Tetraselmis sp. GSL018 TaxID=582737 RepID=A0A061SAN1_9CHLO